MNEHKITMAISEAQTAQNNLINRISQALCGFSNDTGLPVLEHKESKDQ
jgi:hypothetical protein